MNEETTSRVTTENTPDTESTAENQFMKDNKIKMSLTPQRLMTEFIREGSLSNVKNQFTVLKKFKQISNILPTLRIFK